MKATKILMIIVVVIGIVLLMIGVFTPDVADGGGWRDVGSGDVSYPIANMALIAAGVALITFGVAGFLLKEEYQPIEPIVVVQKEHAPETNTDVEKTDVVQETEKVNGPSPDDYLVLRLLNGDERAMFRAIVDAGGEALQKNLITSLKWSNAKVSRVIDRLIEKGVVSKERFGSTNKVKVLIDKE